MATVDSNRQLVHGSWCNSVSFMFIYNVSNQARATDSCTGVQWIKCSQRQQKRIVGQWRTSDSACETCSSRCLPVPLPTAISIVHRPPRPPTGSRYLFTGRQEEGREIVSNGFSGERNPQCSPWMILLPIVLADRLASVEESSVCFLSFGSNPERDNTSVGMGGCKGVAAGFKYRV